MTTYAEHVSDFEEHKRRRAALVEQWPRTAPLPAALVRSIQRFQAGEDGDGASLLAKSAAAGEAGYLAAVKLFVAEEQNHARLLRNVLACTGATTIGGHWTDTVFVGVRRAMGLRLELMTLMLAEVVALRYYRALRDGTDNALLAEVAGRILADEQRHVPFHVDRLRAGFAGSPAIARILGAALWWTLMTGATLVVAADHGPALRTLGVSRRGFVRDVLALFRPIAIDVFGRGRRNPTGQSRTDARPERIPATRQAGPAQATPAGLPPGRSGR